MNLKLQMAGVPWRTTQTREAHPRPENWLYGGVAAGVLVGAAVSTYVWRQRVKAAALLHLTPLERAERLIEACEAKLDSIEKSVREGSEKSADS